ncbi:undecaprenyl-diphosphatase [Idiomarina tyrosinivorans]|uniref:Undecaprenyl-diphosphatase n=1 Tax=Idiomarina tyrosinivorans TaxID=1445662 RepID=A0A432ZLR3_9GAMM|nr:undecaprenyl-diphosphate phosphatase [Idiomarina tyrosinivorans]RUO78162.1 undecaprenyl-diphosphatase [Idiomarina tyrosinivorans]
MTYIEAIFLALIQGLTEFLPISSSAHLILPSQLLGWADQGLAFDVAVHVGTLIAVVWYFKQTVWELLRGWLQSFSGQHGSDSRMAWLIIWATVPAVIAGLLFADVIEASLRSTAVIATTTIAFGILLWWADRRYAQQQQTLAQLTVKQALIIGVAQAIALIPGTSRSGITMTAGLWLGLGREQAARFSFLMSIPVILMAGVYEGAKLVRSDEVIHWGFLVTGIVVSAVSAYLVIALFMRVIERMGMLPFVLYRLALGLVLILLMV